MGPTRRALLACLLLLQPLPAVAQNAIMFAAASLNEALTEIATQWAKSGHPSPQLAFASSSTLARQIEQGAPADLFASADEKWMDELESRHLLAPGTRINLLSNQLVLIVPKDHTRTIAIDGSFDLVALLGPDGRLAVGDPAHVPAGIYARQALTTLGLWSTAEPRLARAADVRGAMRLVELGEAPAGIVYATDAAASDKVVVAGVFPESSHERIVYPFARLDRSDSAEAKQFFAYLRSPASAAVFTGHGFSTLK